MLLLVLVGFDFKCMKEMPFLMMMPFMFGGFRGGSRGHSEGYSFQVEASAEDLVVEAFQVSGSHRKTPGLTDKNMANAFVVNPCDPTESILLFIS